MAAEGGMRAAVAEMTAGAEATAGVGGVAGAATAEAKAVAMRRSRETPARAGTSLKERKVKKGT